MEEMSRRSSVVKLSRTSSSLSSPRMLTEAPPWPPPCSPVAADGSAVFTTECAMNTMR